MNKAVILNARPEGKAVLSDFSIIDIALPQPSEGQLVISTKYISIDPYLRGRMDDNITYTTPFQIGDPFESEAIGEVIESRHPNYKVGDYIVTHMPWQNICIVDVTDGATD